MGSPPWASWKRRAYGGGPNDDAGGEDGSRTAKSVPASLPHQTEIEISTARISDQNRGVSERKADSLRRISRPATFRSRELNSQQTNFHLPMPRTATLDDRNVHYRQRLRPAGRGSAASVARETVELLDAIKQRQGLRSRSQALLKLLEQKGATAQQNLKFKSPPCRAGFCEPRDGPGGYVEDQFQPQRSDSGLSSKRKLPFPLRGEACPSRSNQNGGLRCRQKAPLRRGGKLVPVPRPAFDD